MVYQLSSVLSNYLHKKEYKFGKHSNNENTRSNKLNITGDE